MEAQTDDAPQVLRVLREAAATGRAVILNYARVEGLLRGADGWIDGVRVCDRETGETVEARARAVVNATGAWADKLRGEVGAPPRIRPLRGAHLIVPYYRLPVYQAIAFPHPDDRRPVFVFPWEGVTLVGTTDLDHQADLDEEAAPSPEEITYLLRSVQAHFPELALTEADIMATFAGVRPVISSGQNKAPSKESRDHVLWNEDGLITVTGGKLTTFRHIALATLAALRSRLPNLKPFGMDTPALDPPPL
jgi:glycerol-3-phosphate dehydrogenase